MLMINKRIIISIMIVSLLVINALSSASQMKIETKAKVKGDGYVYSHTYGSGAEDTVNGNGEQIYHRIMSSSEDNVNLVSEYDSLTELKNCSCSDSSFNSTLLNEKGMYNISWRREYGNKCNGYSAKIDNNNVIHSIDVYSGGKILARSKVSREENLVKTSYKIETTGNLTEKLIDTEGIAPLYSADTELKGEITFNSKMEKESERSIEGLGLLHKFDGVTIKSDTGSHPHIIAVTGQSLPPESKAVAYINEALKQYPKAYFDNGTRKRDSDLFLQQALDNLSIATELDPDSYDAWYGKGYVLFQLNKSKEAAEAYDEAIRIKKTGESLGNKALALFKCEDYLGASETYKEALELDPTNAGYLKNYGKALYFLGQYKMAIRQFDESIRILPQKNYEPCFYKGLALLAIGKSQEATTAFAEAKKCENYDAAASVSQKEIVESQTAGGGN